MSARGLLLLVGTLAACCGHHAHAPAAARTPVRPDVSRFPEDVQVRLDLLWTFVEQRSCDRAAPSTPGGGYVMEPPPSDSTSGGIGACDRAEMSSALLIRDLMRLYGGCDACIDECSAWAARQPCVEVCNLPSLAAYEAHVDEFHTNLAAYHAGFPDWARLLEPLAAPPVGPAEALTCPALPPDTTE